MRYTRNLILALVLLLAVACTGQKSTTVGSTTDIEKRIDKLLSRMTLSEKIGQMN